MAGSAVGEPGATQPTSDPSCVITGRGVMAGVPFVAYENVDGERWVIRGTCTACGECEVGAATPRLIWTGVPVGQPGACLDPDYGRRPDIPVRPELAAKMPHCSLTGAYL